ncbi:hypothetical protein ACFX19_045436 [Malus domestica]
MENVKHWYLQCLLSRVNITLAGLIKGVMDLEKPARSSYSEPFNLNEKDFVQMMVLDGCFIIELFRRGISVDQHNKDDPVFSMPFVKEYLYHDLILLENQLPWFVLQRLYNLTAVKNTTREGNAYSLTNLALKFFRQSIMVGGDSLVFPLKILHILDLIRHIINPLFLDMSGVLRSDFDSWPFPQDQHMIDPMSDVLLSHFDSWPFPQGQGPSKRQRFPNATTMSEAGIKFKKGSEMNIVFENGVLTIPPLAIDERTEPIFRNLIAFEQCQYSELRHCPMTLYAFLMDNLIDSSRDIDLLHKSGIVANWLSPEDAAQLFNEMCNDIPVIGFYGRWRVLFYDVNKYCNAKCNKWMEKLRRKHFGTPWAIISLVAAFILLVLTMLQTVYTIHQYYHPPK